jgi:hypothetical protein
MRNESSDDREEPRFPLTVQIAGVLWIVFGVIKILDAVLMTAMMGDQANNPNKAAAPPMGGLFGCGFLVAVAFIVVGYQSFHGTAKDTLGNGAGSIILGLLAGAASVFMNRAPGNDIELAVGMAFGLGLIFAGVLAIVGRTDYKRWRKFQKAQQRMREAESDDEDDRPQRSRRRREEEEDEERP